MDQDQFDKIAKAVWQRLRDTALAPFREHVDKIEFYIMDKPTAEMLLGLPEETAEYPEEICGLHVGVPITQSSIMDPQWEPTRVYIFRAALLDLIAEDEDQGHALREEIAVTLLHEIGHYFGLEEDDLERLGFD